jgi:putative flippase GtrA
MPEPTMAAPQRSIAVQLLSYAIVGLASNLAGYLVYLLMTHLGLGPKVAMTVLYAVGAGIGFWGNRNLTFAHQERGLAVGVRYLLAHGCGYLINFALLYLLVDRWGWAHQIAQGLAIFVVAGFLFASFKFFVFPGVNRSGAQTP